jgi:hypothetical protein
MKFWTINDDDDDWCISKLFLPLDIKIKENKELNERVWAYSLLLLFLNYVEIIQ